MHKLTFFPLGNADSYLVELAGGQRLLFDYANVRDPEDKSDLRVDLPKELRTELADRDYLDVVAFTHSDDDHIHGASEFFYLEHAQKYQGEGRVKIKELWVPAAMVVETGCEGEGQVLRAEARHRLKEGRGIRVFSRPERLKEWLEAEGLTLDQRRHLITDAGQVVPGFSKESDGVEFFAHSPFAKVCDGTLVDRNEGSLVLQAAFVVDNEETRFFLAGDTPCDSLAEMVEVTEYYGNDERLEWDVFKIPHHCSYLTLNNEKGRDVTEPLPAVERLFDRGADRAIVVSTSDPIPEVDTTQPPHRQAANYYRRLVGGKKGQFLVTMEHPTKHRPRPLKIKIDKSKATPEKDLAAPGILLGSQRAPRAARAG